MASKHHLISRLTRIVELFQLYGESGLTFDELNEKLKSTYTDEDLSISLRTFQRDLKDIEWSLKIKIAFDKTSRKYVLTKDALPESTQNNQLFAMESLKMFNVAQDASSCDFIFINERKASGLEYYNVIKEAITQQKYLTFSYQKFNQYKSDDRKIIPMALKESKNRWYVVGFELKNGQKQISLKTFALDRIFEAVAGTKFPYQRPIDIKKHFRDFIGVTTKPIEGFSEAVDIKIETSIEYGKYFSTLPVHSSQRIHTENGKTTVAFHLIPTMEFVAELLSHNTQIRIKEPKQLVTFVKNILQKNLELYR